MKQLVPAVVMSRSRMMAQPPKALCRNSKNAYKTAVLSSGGGGAICTERLSATAAEKNLTSGTYRKISYYIVKSVMAVSMTAKTFIFSSAVTVLTGLLMNAKSVLSLERTGDNQCCA